MLARQARASLESSRSLLKQAFWLRLTPLRGFATENPTPQPPEPVKQAGPTLMVTPTMTEREYAATVVHGRALLAPLRHEKTHGVPVATLHVRGYNRRQLDLFLHFASHAASSLAIPLSEIVRLPVQRSLWTVPKGPFVHKKAQENFDRRVYKRVVKAWDATDNVVDRWLQYIQTYPQPGIGMRIVRWQHAPIGIGRQHTERTSKTQLESQKLENITSRQRVEEVAKNIVKQEMKAVNSGKAAPKVIAQKREEKESAEVPKPEE